MVEIDVELPDRIQCLCCPIQTVKGETNLMAQPMTFQMTARACAGLVRFAYELFPTRE